MPTPQTGGAHRPGAPRADALESDDERALSGYLQAFADRPGSIPAFALSHPRSSIAAIRRLVALPRMTGVVQDTVEGRAIAEEFGRYRSRRYLLGLTTLLELPTAAGEYREGSSKQTLRRKARVAEQHGVHWRPIDDPAERARVLHLANLHERTGSRAGYRVQDPDNDDLLDARLWLVAFGRNEQPLLLSVTPYDGEYAMLRFFKTISCDPDASPARYFMTEVLVEQLRARGVRYLLDAAVPHWLPNGLRHFQRMLGFRLTRLRLRTASH